MIDKRNSKKHFLLLLLVLTCFLGGCGSKDTLKPTPAIVPTAVNTPAEVPVATNTPRPASTETPTLTPEPTKEEVPFSALENLRVVLRESNSYCGLAYLGYAETIEGFLASEAAEGYREEFSFLWELSKENLISCGGMEIYCIVPVSETMSVAVYELVYDWESETMESGPGAELYRTEKGIPVIIQGNASDIIPNMQVVITLEHGEHKKITPYISLRDGSTAVTGDTEGIYDFTIYPEGFVKETD